MQGSDGFIAFVGSRRKYESLAKKLKENGISEEKIKSVQSPAGMDIGAVTPEEIALSILASLTTLRRKAVRGEAAYR